MADSAENVKRANVDATDEQLRELKRLRQEEPKSFKRKGNEIQYKFNRKLQDTLDDAKSHLEANAVEKAKESLSFNSICSMRFTLLHEIPLHYSQSIRRIISYWA